MVRGYLERSAGRPNEAFDYYERSVVASRESGYFWWEKNALTTIAAALFDDGRPEQAQDRAREALNVAVQIGDRRGVLDALALCARGFAERGDMDTAGRLVGAIEAELDRRPGHHWHVEGKDLIRPLSPHRGRQFEAGREAGRTLSLDDAVQHALRSVD
jgi:hypothetical protein